MSVNGVWAVDPGTSPEAFFASLMGRVVGKTLRSRHFANVRGAPEVGQYKGRSDNYRR
jgi:hypothetical protein